MMKIQNKIKSDYEELKIKPSANLWDKIDQKLHEPPEINIKPAFQWWKYSAAAVLAMISTGAFFYFNQDEPTLKQKSISIVKSAEKQNDHSSAMTQNDANIQNTAQNTKVIPSEKSRLVANEKKKPGKLNAAEREDFNASLAKTASKDSPLKNPTSITPTSDHHELYTADVAPAENKIALNNEKSEIKTGTPEQKPTKYIQAHDLLAGRELDKAAKEIKDKQFAVVDLDKIKSPNSLKIMGIEIYSSSEK